MIPLLPQLIALLLLLVLLLLLGPRRIAKLLRRIRKIGFAGFEIELDNDLDVLSEERRIPKGERQTARTRRAIENAADLLSCAQLLWVDDRPEGNLREMLFLRRLCVQIDLARSNKEAESAMRRKVYDVVVSDIHREGRGDEGIDLAPIAAAAAVPPELVYYVMQSRPTPPGAVGLTARPDELFLLIIEGLRRRRETPIRTVKGHAERG